MNQFLNAKKLENALITVTTNKSINTDMGFTKVNDTQDATFHPNYFTTNILSAAQYTYMTFRCWHQS